MYDLVPNKLIITTHNYTSIYYILVGFIILYICLVIDNYDTLDIENGGKLCFYTVMTSLFLFVTSVLLNIIKTNTELSIYFGIFSNILLFFSIIILFLTYDKYEIRDNFITDPLSVGVLILFIFCLLSLMHYDDNNYMTSQETSSQETSSQETSSQKTSSQETSSQETS